MSKGGASNTRHTAGDVLMIFDLVAVWVWIAISSTLTLIGVWLAYQRLRIAGTAFCAGAISLLGVAIYQLHPTLARYRLPTNVLELQIEQEAQASQIVDLKSKLASLRTKYDDLLSTAATASVKARGVEPPVPPATNNEDHSRVSSELSKLAEDFLETRADLKRQKDAIADLSQRLDTETKSHASTSASLARTNDTLRSSEAERLSLDAKLGQATNRVRILHLRTWAEQRARKRAQHLLLMSALRPRGAREGSVPLCEASQSIALRSAEQLLERPPDSGFFLLRKHADPALVTDQAGTYYSVEVHPTAMDGLIFKVRHYNQLKDASAFKRIVERLRDEILHPLQDGNVLALTLYIRGGADRGGALGTLSPDDSSYTDVGYLPLMPESLERYQGTAVRQTITKTLLNDHLPVLRAAFAQQTLLSLAPSVPTAILQGSSAGVGESDRSLQFIVFVRPKCRPPDGQR
jgi:hypothetical protein